MSEMGLALEDEVVAEVLLGRKSAEQTLSELLEHWGAAGSIQSGAFYLRRPKGWSKLVDWPLHSRWGGIRWNTILEQVLAVDVAQPSAKAFRVGTLLGFSLGSPDEEIARLVVKPIAPVSELPTSVFSALTLFLYALRDRERGEVVGFSGEMSRRMIQVRKDAGDVAWRDEFPEIVGRSRALHEVLALTRKAASADVSVLVNGESGTGKEMLARALHRRSDRSSGPFVSENCAALSESLLEAEIFGSEKGAYTGADSSRPGLIERANGGTLFLDEIGEMGKSLQTKLLRALQEREVRRVGGTQLIPIDFRLVTATHKDLDVEVREGRFREDLYFRINVMRLPLPSLRERPEDIPLLIERFVAEICERRGIAKPTIHEEALDVLMQQPWPGNIRQLRNEVERALAISPEEITPDVLSVKQGTGFIPTPVARRVREELGNNIYSVERVVLGGVIQEVLEEAEGNKAKAARILGIPKTNLYRRLRRYGIPVVT